MISVTEKDRDVQRFLWVDDITSDSPEVYTAPKIHKSSLRSLI